MKKCLFIGLVVVLYTPFAVLAGTGKEKESSLKVAYVSVNEAVEKTGEQEKIRRSLEKERDRIQRLIRKKSETFSKEALKIRKAMALLSEDEKVKKYESMQKMQLEMDRFAEQKKVEFQQKESTLRANVIGKVKTIVDIVAKAEKVDIIRNKDGTLWVRPKLDLTGKVVRMYKKKYK